MNTTDDLILTLRKQVDGLERATAIAVTTVHALQMEELFSKGQGGSGTIGQYNSTHPLYINPKKSPKKFATKGKTGKSQFKNGKTHKTGYFNSYKDFRSKIGRETSFVNLNLTGDLFRDINNSLAKTSPDTYTSSVKRDGNLKKYLGLVKKYPGAFNLSPALRKKFIEVAELEAARVLS